MGDNVYMVPTEFAAIMPMDVLCPMCEGHGLLMMENWNHKKPCPVCKGVGQMNEFRIPSTEAMVLMVLEITPPNDRRKVFEALAGAKGIY